MNQHYIFKLLKENSRVIIPNFGAFLLKEKKSKGTLDGSETLNISFNDFLKFNDGVLVDYIALKDKVNKIEAELQVTDFVSLINSKLDEEGRFVIENIGELIKDSTGKIRLRKDEILSQSKEEVKEEQKVIKIKPEIKEPEVKKEILKPKPVVKIPEAKPKHQSPKIEKAVSETPVDYTLYEKKRGGGLWILLIALVVVIAGALYFTGYLDSILKSDLVGSENGNNDILKEETFSGQETQNSGAVILPDTFEVIADSVDLVESDSLDKDSNIISGANDLTSFVENEELEEAVVDYYDGKYYHIIAASYPNLKAAEKFIVKLNSEGYHSRIINKKGNHYRVSYDSFKTKSEAIEKLKEITTTKNKNAWYLYHVLD